MVDNLFRADDTSFVTLFIETQDLMLDIKWNRNRTVGLLQSS